MKMEFVKQVSSNVGASCADGDGGVESTTSSNTVPAKKTRKTIGGNLELAEHLNDFSPHYEMDAERGAAATTLEEESYVLSAEDVQQVDVDDVESCRWRIQIRKGISGGTGNGVTTLVDILFNAADVSDASNA